ncbi:MAG: hypothetical protein R3Y28_04200 [Candidatus Gastranaerophilales bacterium]
MTNINFGASLINRPNIKKLSNGNYINTKANFVELSCSKNIQENVDDKKAITELRAKWLTPFSSNINKEINQPQIPSKVHFYALTTQRKNLKKLDPDEILAIAKYIQEPKERDYLSLLQVNPQYTSTNSISQSKYRHCGKAMRLIQSNIKK